MISLDVEKIFKDKVNWKFYNFIKDRAIEYEDNGGVVDIKIDVRGKSDIMYRSMYRYRTNDRECFLNVFSQTNLEFINTQYEKYGLYYEIDIYEKPEDVSIGIKNAEYEEGFIDKMQDRCIIVNDFPIVLQPKFK